MARDINGNYSLPAGNPVIVDDLIEEDWANATLDDLATAMQDSLSRSGDGGMLAGLKAYAGVISAPGYTWSDEPSSGWYRASAGDFRYAIGGADILKITASGLTIPGTLSLGMVDAKGDLLIGTAADTVARKAVGTKGQLFVPDSAQSDGWAFKTAGTNGYTLAADSTQSDGLIWTPYASAANNAIIGGDFSTNPWQRGTSIVTPTTGQYVADRWAWLNSASGPGAVTISQSADAPTVAQAGVLASHCMLVDCTTIDATIAAGDLYGVTQRIEGFNWMPLAQRSIVLQFWHKHTKTGTYCVAVSNGIDRSYVAEYTQAVADTWEFASVVIPASPSAGTWNYTNGTGAYLVFSIAIGSTYQTTAGAWNPVAAYATSNQVNGLDSTSNNFRIALVDLRPGNVVLPVQSRDVGTEKLLAYRYYWEWQAGSTSDIVCIAQAYNASNSQGVIALPVEMRAAPALTLSAASDFKTLQAGAASSDACSSITIISANKASASLAFSSANLVAGDATRVDAGGSASAKLKFDSEL